MDEKEKGKEKQNGALFSRDELLGMERPRERFTPPGYDKAVQIHALNALEQSRYNSSIMEMRTDENGRVQGVARMEGAQIRLCAMGLDEPKLSEAEVGGLPNDLVQAVAERIRKLSGMDRTVEEAEGN